MARTDSTGESKEPILREQGDSIAGGLKPVSVWSTRAKRFRFGIEGADLHFSRNNRWFGPWLVLVLVWVLACPASASIAGTCICCGPAETAADDCGPTGKSADDCCAGEQTSAGCDDVIGDCCLMASIGDASRYAVLPAIERTGDAAKYQIPTRDVPGLSSAPGLASSLHESVLAIAPPPRLDALTNAVTRETAHPSPPTYLLHAVFLR